METTTTDSSGPLIYVVKRGNTLYSIARWYGTTVEAIALLNRIPNPSLIYVGQQLTIPRPYNTVYIVRWGDTLYSIARRYGTTVEAIAARNNIANPSLIYAGQRLDLSGSSTSTPPTGNMAISATAISSTEIELDWTDTANETGYWVYWRTGNTDWHVAATMAHDSTSYTADNLAPETTYQFYAQAFNDAGTKTSNVVSATTLATPEIPPSGQIALAATVLSSTEIELDWTDTANETGYRMYRKTGNASWGLATTTGNNVTNYTAVNLAPETTYQFYVQAFNDAGTKTSNTVSATTEPTATLLAPTLAGPPSTTGRFELTWTFDWPTAGHTDDHYELEQSYDPDFSSIAKIILYQDGERASPFIIQTTPTANGIGATTYFRVRAKAAGDFSPYSNVIATYCPELNTTYNADFDNRMERSSLDPSVQVTVYQDGEIAVGTTYFVAGSTRSYVAVASALRFDDLETVISDKTIVSARLRLTPFEVAEPGRVYAVYPFAQQWDPTTLTFATVPGFYSEPHQVFDSPLTAGNPLEIDVTSIVQLWADGGSNHGIILLDTEFDPDVFLLSPADYRIHLYSNETAPTDDQRPALLLLIR
jgi:LysM repeat protein